MPQPYNYQVQPMNLGQAFMRGQANAMTLDAARKKRERDEAYRTALGQSMRSGKGFDGIMGDFPEYQKETMNAFGFRSQEDVKTARQEFADLFGAMAMGPEGVADHLQKQRALYAEAGDANEVASYDQMIQAHSQNPEGFEKSMREKHLMMFPEDAKIISGVKAKPKELSLEEQKVANQKEAIKANLLRIGIDQEKLDQMPAGTRAEIFKLGDVARENRKTQMEIDGLLSETGVNVGPGGFYSIATEAFKKFTGNRDAVSAWRTKAEKIINMKVMQSLPKGPASDRDISIVRAGFPPPEAGDAEFRKYFNAATRLMDAVNKYNDIEIAWLSEFDNQGKARKKRGVTEMPSVMGQEVKEGETYDQFFRRNQDNFVQDQFITPEGRVVTGSVAMINELKKRLKIDE